MTRDELLQFARRDWSAVEEEKARYWARRKHDMTPAEALRLGHALRRHAAALRPDWPSDAERREDLDTHARVAEALRAVTRAAR